MKNPILTQCPRCGLEQDVFGRLDETQIQLQCQCGADLTLILQGFTIGDKLLSRSRYEFKHNFDYSLCIVFSAMAIECELSRLYFKWAKISTMFEHEVLTEIELEASLRKYGNIAIRMEEIVKLIYPTGLRAFIAADINLRDTFLKDFPFFDVNNVGTSFQEELFWPRNKILHLGFAKYDSQKAEYCFYLASLGLEILHSIENQKYIVS